MGFLGYFFIIYFCSLILKISGVAGFKEISWGWFIIMPILVPILRLLGYIISFCFFAGLALLTVWSVCQLLIWIG